MGGSARGRLKSLSASGAGPLSSEAVAAALRAEVSRDLGAEAAVREALVGLGADAPSQARRKAAADALSAAGAPSGSVDVDEALAKAAQPGRVAPAPAAVEDAIYQMSANIPSAGRLDELARLAMDDPEPNAPPPKSGVDAYRKYRKAFDRVEREYGLKPSQIIPFPAVESSFGENTGKFPLRDTLLAIRTDARGRFKPEQREQAGRDLAALTRLLAAGDLGGRRAEGIRGSNMGAIGVTQFLPSSWDAYGRSMRGGRRDPWNFGDAVLSTGNYLDQHGARRSYDQAILAYNRSEKYRRQIRQYGANVEPGVAAARGKPATPSESESPPEQ